MSLAVSTLPLPDTPRQPVSESDQLSHSWSYGTCVSRDMQDTSTTDVQEERRCKRQDRTESSRKSNSNGSFMGIGAVPLVPSPEPQASGTTGQCRALTQPWSQLAALNVEKASIAGELHGPFHLQPDRQKLANDMTVAHVGDNHGTSTSKSEIALKSPSTEPSLASTWMDEAVSSERGPLSIHAICASPPGQTVDSQKRRRSSPDNSRKDSKYRLPSIPELERSLFRPTGSSRNSEPSVLESGQTHVEGQVHTSERPSPPEDSDQRHEAANKLPSFSALISKLDNDRHTPFSPPITPVRAGASGVTSPADRASPSKPLFDNPFNVDGKRRRVTAEPISGTQSQQSFSRQPSDVDPTTVVHRNFGAVEPVEPRFEPIQLESRSPHVTVPDIRSARSSVAQHNEHRHQQQPTSSLAMRPRSPPPMQPRLPFMVSSQAQRVMRDVRPPSYSQPMPAYGSESGRMYSLPHVPAPALPHNGSFRASSIHDAYGYHDQVQRYHPMTHPTSYMSPGLGGSPDGYHFGAPGNQPAHQSRKRRGNLPKDATALFKNWFLNNKDNPYPTEEQKQEFVRQTGCTIAQVSNWFINARRRFPKKDAEDLMQRDGELDANIASEDEG